MGQRSQIYVRVDGILEVANYYQWNYGDRMISRARYGIEWIKQYIEYPWTMQRNGGEFEKFRRIWDVNFDYKDIVLSTDIFKEWKELFQEESFKDYCFEQQATNDGQLFVDVDTEKKIVKIALTDCDNNILTPDEYMDWDMEGWRNEDYKYMTKAEKRKCLNNIKVINKMTTQMTRDELIKFKA